MNRAECFFCDRTCPACGYPVTAGFIHKQQPQPPGSSHVVCELRRYIAPVTDAIGNYLTHVEEHG